MNSCKYESKLDAYLDKALSPDAMRELGGHIKRCTNCRTTLKALKHIEALFKQNTDILFETPDEAYWEKVPKSILASLNLNGLHESPEPAFPKRELSNFTLWDKMRQFFELPSVKIGFAGGMAVLLALVLLTRDSRIEPPMASNLNQEQSESADNSAGSKQTAIEGLQSEVENTVVSLEPSESSENGVIAERSGESVEKAETATQQLAADAVGDETQNDVQASENASVADLAMSGVKPKSLHHTAPEVGARMVTVPNPDYIIDEDEPAEKKSNDADIVGVVSATDVLSGAGRKKVDQSTPEKLTDDESDFAETRWIVQESQTLAEKKSIWLSYIAREKNSTYREMGIYNLALVLTEIAQESKDPEDAAYAITFFKENETSLRQQLSDNRFEMKLDMLKLIHNF